MCYGEHVDLLCEASSRKANANDFEEAKHESQMTIPRRAARAVFDPLWPASDGSCRQQALRIAEELAAANARCAALEEDVCAACFAFGESWPRRITDYPEHDLRFCIALQEMDENAKKLEDLVAHHIAEHLRPRR